MFISSYEKLRTFLIDQKTITSLVQLEYSGFAGATVPICTFTFHNTHMEGYKGGYVRLSDFVGSAVQGPKTLEAIANHECGWFYRADADSFKDIPGSPIAYWASEATFCVFKNGVSLNKIGQPRQGLATGKNDLFVRCRWEVSRSKSKYDSTSIRESIQSACRWFPYNKGGDYRKWYGNNDYVIDWENDGERVRTFPGSVIRNPKTYFQSAITWSKISSGSIAFRLKPAGHIYDVAGTSIFLNDADVLFVLGALNSSSILAIAAMLSPTLNFEVGQVATYPVLDLGDHHFDVERIVKQLLRFSKEDWDSNETSWDFICHPLL